ncbi:MAG TPA: glycosyltransferase family 39 protein [Gemmatimonadaceae bacterium]|nr:glycosyltransferase family 39 protein [Gemmatimonadaceae bacterium]
MATRELTGRDSGPQAGAPPGERTSPPVGRRELVVVAVVVAALLAIPMLVPALRVMYLKPLWLDELHTWLLARELPGPVLVQRLRDGADFNPPLLFVVDAFALRILDDLPPQLALRLTSIVSVGMASLLLYRIFRERLGVLPSVIGAIAPLAHSTVLVQLREARFYAPWLALTVVAAWSMQRLLDDPSSRGRFLQLTLASAAVCLIHYFGVISLACLGIGLAIGVRSPARLLRPAAATALGALALAAWLPVYAEQRRVLSVPTWVDAPTLKGSAVFVALYWAWPAFAVIILAGILWAFKERRRAAPGMPRPTAAQWAMVGLLALPIIFVAFSYLVQPTMVSRYALPAVLGMSTLVAFAVARLPRLVQGLALAAIVAAHGVLLWRQSDRDRSFQRDVNGAVAALNAVAGDPRPVIATDRHTLYPAAMSSVNRNGNVAYLVAPTSVVRAQYGPAEEDMYRFTILERDMSVTHNAIFGFPALLPRDSVRRMRSFYVLLPDSAETPGREARLDGFRPCRMQRSLLRYDASPGHRMTARSADEIPLCERLPAPSAG